ncbi:MAG TPA: alginate export family protein [Bacteroidota bacterium]|nr:alginate export family protein [Bacteroidota bacterium]
MNATTRCICLAVVAVLLLTATMDELSAQVTESGQNAPENPERPEINWHYRWQEDWSILSDTTLRTDPFDLIKYIRIGPNPQSYLSLGATIRERFESVSYRLGLFQPDDYLIDRTQLHADLHLGTYLRIFTQVVDARAFGKTLVGPIDQDRLDLEQAFASFTLPVGTDKFTITAGRQEPKLDLQRFADIRDGPNVRQPFNSVAADYTSKNWQAVGFYSQPVFTVDEKLFDDFSNNHFTISGVRFEHYNVGPGTLSLFAAQLRNDNAFYLIEAGSERRNVLDMRYTGRSAGWDWDVEGMDQWGDIETKNINAWGVGGLIGYSWTTHPWSPRLGLQIDAASGTDNPNGNTLGTFNPLFPSGFYELLAGYPGYANFVHLKLSVRMLPLKTLSVLLTTGSMWRETTADAVYLLPVIPILGTAGTGNAYSGSYYQVRFDWTISPHLASAIDAEYFAHSQSLHQAGASNGRFVGGELRFGI